LRLISGGSVQSVAVPPGTTPRGYWRAMLPARSPDSALVLGLGGGTIVHLLWQTNPSLPVVGVDVDGTALELARRHFGLTAPSLRLVQSDALAFVRRCRERFGLVIVDLFAGESLAQVVSMKSFQRRIRQLAAPGGTVVWNLHRDPRSRTARHQVTRGLLLERRVLAGLNLVLHLERRRHRMNPRR
jgi:spermidine synthase